MPQGIQPSSATLPPPLRMHPPFSRRRSWPQVQADYSYEVLPERILLLRDLAGLLGHEEPPVSLTNDMANVLVEVARQAGLGSLTGYRVLYRDSEHTWAGVALTAAGRFASFYGLGQLITIEAQALAALRARSAPATH